MVNGHRGCLKESEQASQRDGSLPQRVIRWICYTCASIRAIRTLRTAVKNFYGDYCLPLYPMAQPLMLQGFERGEIDFSFSPHSLPNSLPLSPYGLFVLLWLIRPETKKLHQGGRQGRQWVDSKKLLSTYL